MKKFRAKANFVDVLIVLVPALAVLAGAGYYWFVMRQPAPTNQSGAEQQVDARPLEVEVIKPERTVYNPITEVTVISNKEISFAEHSRIEDVNLVGELPGSYYYVVTIANIPTAGANVTLNISDKAGNEFSEQLKIEKEGLAFPAGLSSIRPWPDSEYILDADDLEVVVSRSARLFEDYEPQNLLDLNKKFGLYTLNNAMLRDDAARALDSMIRDLRRDLGNSDITIVSGYRSYETQVATYVGHLRNLGEKRASEVSARPGHSEHQLGTTVDFAKPSQNYSLEKFADSKESDWLKEFAGEYGFQQFTDPDYAEEPWQYRYVGIEEV